MTLRLTAALTGDLRGLLAGLLLVIATLALPTRSADATELRGRVVAVGDGDGDGDGDGITVLTDQRQRLRVRLAEIRAAECAWAEGGCMPGIFTGAAPVMHPKRVLAAAVAIAAAAPRWPTPRSGELGDAARATAAAIQREWSGLEPERAVHRIA